MNQSYQIDFEAGTLELIVEGQLMQMSSTTITLASKLAVAKAKKYDELVAKLVEIGLVRDDTDPDKVFEILQSLLFSGVADLPPTPEPYVDAGRLNFIQNKRILLRHITSISEVCLDSTYRVSLLVQTPTKPQPYNYKLDDRLVPRDFVVRAWEDWQNQKQEA